MKTTATNILLVRPGLPRDHAFLDKIKASLQTFKEQVTVHEVEGLQDEAFKNMPRDVREKIDACVVNWQPPAFRLALEYLPNLKWLHSLYVGVDKILTPEIHAKLKSNGITLTNSRGVSSKPLAEFIMAASMHFAKHFSLFDKWQKEGAWKRTTISNLFGRTMLIIGYGNIGAATAKIAKRGFDMTVIGLKRSLPREGEEFENVDKLGTLSDLDQYLPTADYIVLCLPLTEGTRKILGAKQFSLMKPTAVVVNVGRGETIDEAALIEALRTDQIAGAALDVFEKEPLEKESPFYKDEHVMKKTLLTNHSMEECVDNQDEHARRYAENMQLYIEGGKLKNIVDIDIGY